MATKTDIYKRTMLDVFMQKAKPTMFLSSWFKSSPQNMFSSKTCVIDVKRGNQLIAVDVVRGTGGLLVNNKRFTTKEFTPPVYDLYNAYDENELLKRMPGQTEYASPAYMAQLLALITDDQVVIQDMILRAIEKQASDALFTGTITPVKDVAIDFKQKATHLRNAAANWSTTTNKPWDDLAAACTLCVKDGLITTSNRFIGVFSNDAWTEYEACLLAAGKLDTLNDSATSLIAPTMNTMGAVYMGTIKAGPYVIEAWTYPQYYDVPSADELGGITLTGAGTKVAYVPVERVLVIPAPSAIDLRLVFAGIPQLTDRVESGFVRLPQMAVGDFHPYAYTDDEKVTAKIGIRSAPLCIPTQIDGYVVQKTRTS